jgi:hypothetical protein
MTEKINPSFLAGYIDCDGGFQLQVNIRKSTSGRKNIRLNPRISISFKDGKKQREVLEAIRDVVGGSIYFSNEGKENAKVNWMTTNVEDCIRVARYVLPCLCQKEEIAKRFIWACEVISNGKTRRKGTNMYGGEKIYSKEEMIEMVKIATSLNETMQVVRFRESTGRNFNFYLKEIDQIYS